MSLLAQYSLLLWTGFSLWLFNRLDTRVAIVAIILGGYLMLPNRAVYDLPVLPALDKYSVPVFIVVVLLFLRKTTLQGVLRGPIPRSFFVLGLIALWFGANFGTALTNGDLLRYGPRVIPSLGLYDAFAFSLATLVMLLPMLVARKYFARPQDHKLLLQLLVLAGLIYSIPALYEIRMSPQLNRIFYGYFPHHWLQHIRGDGFRPLVFLQHGLWLSLFLSGAVLAAAGLWRAEKDPKRKNQYLIAFGWLFMTLFLSKSLGAFMVTVVLLPLIMITNVRLQMLAGMTISAMVLTYPLLRSADVVPIESFIGFVERNISEDRASSLSFRLEHENELLEKARERYTFGWGGYGRNRIVDERTGDDLTVSDGQWIITLSLGGLALYLAQFGLLCIAPVRLAFASGRFGLDQYTATLILILAGNLVDLIPNAGMTVITWTIAGALWGRLELGRVVETAEAHVPADPVAEDGAAPSRYRRPTFVNKARDGDRTRPAYTRQIRQTYSRNQAKPSR